MKLIGSTSSPYVRKVRVVMAEKKLDYQFVEEDVWSADTTIMHSNPLGKVPCLVMEGGEALFDSRVIVEYLDTLSPVGKLMPGFKARLSTSFSKKSHLASKPMSPIPLSLKTVFPSSCTRVRTWGRLRTRSTESTTP